MNRWTTWCAALLLTVFALPSLADDALLGSWTLTTIDETELGDEQQVAYAFTADTVRVTLGSAGLSQTWELAYSVSEEGELTLEPADGLGEATPSVFTYRVEDGKLILESDELGVPMTFTRVEAGE